MSTDANHPKVSLFRGVLLGTLGQYSPDRPDAVWSLCNGQSTVPCIIPSSDLLHRLLSQPLCSHWLQMVDWFPSGNLLAAATPVLTDAWPDEHVNDALWQLPPDVCPVDGAYRETLDLIDTISTAPLRKLVERVLANREVCSRFWTMPASARHHHAHPGGLAIHSLEVALDLASQSSLSEHERDLCVAAGLLHDIGKVWSYTNDMFPNTAGRAMGHELMALSRLEQDLMHLESEWPDGAYALRVLLSGCGRLRQDGSMPSALVARVKAADQRSCELERNMREPSRQWKPRQWLPPPPLDAGARTPRGDS